MSIAEKFNNYITDLANDYTKTGNTDFILVTMDETGNFNFSGGIDYIYLLEFFCDYDDDLTPKEILEIELSLEERSIGAIYKRINGKFELIVKKGF